MYQYFVAENCSSLTFKIKEAKKVMLLLGESVGGDREGKNKLRYWSFNLGLTLGH